MLCIIRSNRSRSFASLNGLLKLHFTLLPQSQLKFASVCKLCESVIACFKTPHISSLLIIERQMPLGIKTFSQGIYTKQLTLGVFKNHWNLRYVNPGFLKKQALCFASTLSRTSLSRTSLCNAACSRTKVQSTVILALFVK